jgi:hypothetical protein
MLETPPQARVRDLIEADETASLRLWTGFCNFYEVVMSDEQTNLTWERLINPASSIKGLVAENSEGRVIGMCNYILHDNTCTATPVCYLEDLYVEHGGEDMIQELIDRMKRKGWARV